MSFSQETELLAILPGDAASSQYDIFSGEMVLKKLFCSNTEDDS